MRIGIISDIHGNLPALKVILNKFEEEKCDYIYCLGDAIAIGPFSGECIELLLGLPNVKFIMGNHEEYFVQGVSNIATNSMSQGEKIHQAFIADTLTEELRDIISKFPYSIEENIESSKILFTHYALNHKENCKAFKSIEKNITVESMDKLFEEVDADLIFFGHEHKSCNIKGKRHYVNVGSSGCTKDDVTHCTIVDLKDKSYNINVYKMKYNKEDIFKALEDRQVPEREFIAKIFFGRI
jgi:predicted phosphodiesterase